MGGRFFVGVLIGYALKNLIKIVFIIVGLFFAAVAYLHYHQIATLNWNKLQTVSEDAIIAGSVETSSFSEFRQSFVRGQYNIPVERIKVH